MKTSENIVSVLKKKREKLPTLYDSIVSFFLTASKFNNGEYSASYNKCFCTKYTVDDDTDIK